MTEYYLAIDPGLLTGLSLWAWEPGKEPELIWSAESTYDDFAMHIRGWYEKYPDLRIVCERFVITAATAKKTQAPYSLELIGQLKLIMRDHFKDSNDIALQSPADAMTVFPNPKLKKLGYWHRGGEGHALDSIRHGLLYFMKHGWKPVGLLA